MSSCFFTIIIIVLVIDIITTIINTDIVLHSRWRRACQRWPTPGPIPASTVSRPPSSHQPQVCHDGDDDDDDGDDDDDDGDDDDEEEEEKTMVMSLTSPETKTLSDDF